MSTRNQGFIVHPATGGLDTTTPPSLLKPEQLTLADNIEYDVQSRKRRLGTGRYNAAAITGTPTVTAVADFWRHGASLSPTQKYVAAAGTKLYKDDGDGVWDVINAAWGTGTSNTYVTIAGGYAVFSTDNGDAPRTWDQTTEAALGGSPPAFNFSVFHLRRLFVNGGAANPSDLPFSAGGSISTWSGSDSSKLVLDEDDGDRLMGLSQPFLGDLYAFKGPANGSVWRLGGRTMLSFTKDRLFPGAPCVSHGSIVTTPTDIFWMSRYGVHSLQATQKYGDAEQFFLSKPIQSTFRSLNIPRLAQARAFYHPNRNIVGWFVPDGASTTNNLCLVYNYARGQWSTWSFTGMSGASCAVMLDVAASSDAKKPRLFIGGYGGFVWRGDSTTLTDDNGSVYTPRIRTAIVVRLGDTMTELHEKSFATVTTFFRPVGNFFANLDVTIDGATASYNVPLVGNRDTLG